MKYVIAAVLALIIFPAQADLDWQLALEGSQRSPEHKARDSSRHPRETLEFFGIREGMTVLEVSPGGGWYTEVLAPLLQGNGTYYAAHYDMNASSSYYRNSLGKYLQKLAANNDVYSSVIVTQLQLPQETPAAPEGSVDLAVTFRNMHNWVDGGSLDANFAAIYATLKPGGTFGVVQHRAKPGASVADLKDTGYVTQAHIIAAAKVAGFTLEASSEINANPRDSADHPKGVWTLPPGYRLGDVERARYSAIGESDRMTLKFSKPEK